MTITPSLNDIKTSRYAIPLFLALIAAGLAGNYFPFAILNAHFIFGSIFAMLALQFFGFGRGVVAAAVIAVFSLMTLQRNRVWKDGLSLWTDTVARSPLSVTARNNLALAYAGEGRIHEAIRELERAVELSPRDAESRINLGSLHALAGSRDRAEAELRLAVRLSPASASAHYNLGRLLDMAGRPGEAAAEYGAALRIRPCHLEARNNLAALYATEGDYRRARAEWGRVLALDPSNPQARNNLRELSAIEGRPRLESRREGRHSP